MSREFYATIDSKRWINSMIHASLLSGLVDTANYDEIT